MKPFILCLVVLIGIGCNAKETVEFEAAVKQLPLIDCQKNNYDEIKRIAASILSEARLNAVDRLYDIEQAFSNFNDRHESNSSEYTNGCNELIREAEVIIPRIAAKKVENSKVK